MKPNSKDRQWILEDYRPGDEREILELFNEGFGKNRSLEHWDWKFGKNPYGAPTATLARRTSDRRLVGTYIVIPFPLNVRGQRTLACQTVDLIVHPEYRYQGIFEAAAVNCHKACREAGGEAVIAFPNPSADSYPGFVRTLGWDRILFPKVYVRKIRIGRKLKRIVNVPLLTDAVSAAYSLFPRLLLTTRRSVLKNQVGKSLDFSMTESVPEGYDDLWKSWRSLEILSIWKDSQYFRWRYDENPDHRFTYFFLTSGDTIVALAVVVRDGPIATICELMVRDWNVSVGKLLIHDLSLYYTSKGIEEISFMGYDSGFHEAVLEGFDVRDALEIALVGEAFEGGSLQHLFPISKNWTMTLGDTDIV